MGLINVESSPSRLVSAFIAFAILCCVCVILCAVGFVRLELQLKTQEEQIVSLRNDISKLQNQNKIGKFNHLHTFFISKYFHFNLRAFT